MKKIHKLGLAAASGLLSALGFNSCHQIHPVEYGTPMQNPSEYQNQDRDNGQTETPDNPGKQRKVREDLEVVKPLYGVQPNPRVREMN